VHGRAAKRFATRVGAMRGIDGCIDIRLIALRDTRDHAPGRGFQRVESFTR